MKRHADLHRHVTREYKEEMLIERLDKCINPLEVVELLCFIVAEMGYDKLVHQIEEGVTNRRWAG